MAGESNEQSIFMTELRSLVEKASHDSAYNGVGITKSPAIAAMISKLHQPVERKNLDPAAESTTLHSVYPSVSQITRQVMGRVEDNENTFKLFPDIELAAQIIISSIVSPKDMLKTELNFRLDAPNWPQSLIAKITDIIREEVVENYGLEDEVYDILRDALFIAGSHPKLILPEAAVDHVINNSSTIATESINSTGLFNNGDILSVKSMGILGNPHRPDGKVVSALESIFSVPAEQLVYDAALYVDPDSISIDEDVFLKDKILDLARDNTSVIDNVQYLKLPELIKKGQRERVLTAISGRESLAVGVLATESSKSLREDDKAKKITPDRLKGALYKGAKAGYKPYVHVPGSMSLRRRSVGRPLVMNLSAESVVPVYTPGDYKRHIGYFIAVDVDGNPITLDSTVAEFGQGMSTINQSDKTNSSTSSLLTERAAKNILSDNYTPVIQDIATIYAEVIERDLVQRLANGIYHQEVEIGKNMEIYRVMFTRALQSKATRLIYVPGEYVTYFAFKYHRNGVGRSYLDDLANIIGMRAMALFSSLWAKVRSSISTVKTTIKFDPKDPDPVKTIELVKHLIARSRQQYFPNGLRRVADFTDWIQSAGIQIGWEGHPKLPATSLDFEAQNVDHVQPDDSLEETLRHMTYMHFGLSPETVDTAARQDFATTVQQQGVLFSKRIQMLGKVFAVDLTDYTQKLAMNDEIIQNRIVEVFEAHKTDIQRMLEAEGVTMDTEDHAEKVALTRRLIVDLISRIRVSVPEPDTTSLVNMKNEIENYEQLIDKALEFIASDKVLPSDLAGDEAAQYIQNIREVWKAELMRRFLNDNNVVPEVFELASKDDKGMPSTLINEVAADHSKTMMALVLDLLNRMKEPREAVTDDLQSMNTEPGDGGTDSSYDSSSDSDTSSDSEGGDDFGSGDFEEMPGEDEIPPEETPAA